MPENHHRQPPDTTYEWADFESDWQTLGQAASPMPGEGMAHFQARNRSANAARWQAARFWVSRAYLDQFADQFSEFVMTTRRPGEPMGRIVAAELVHALWRCFSEAPDSYLHPDHWPEPGLIIELAHEAQGS